jgi:simple sugar transport system permease protein
MAAIAEKRISAAGIINSIGVPTLIIGGFYLIVLAGAYLLKMPMNVLFSDTFKRFAMNGVLVLAMLPSIQSGTGPNFALPLGISFGLLAMVICMEFDLMGVTLLLASGGLAIVFAVIVGFLYGKLLNAVKGAEMTIATYMGFATVALLSLVWLMAPFKNKKMGWMLGSGLRETIQLDAYEVKWFLNDLWAFKIFGVTIPTGLLLIFFLACFIVWFFFRSKTGIAIAAGGTNPAFAGAAGINHDKNRIIANIISTVFGAVGIILYSQSFGYVQIYSGPLMMAFPAVAGILIGGATASRAKIRHVLIGTFLFQGLLTTSMPVANELFTGTDLAEIMRAIIQNGIILYALTQVKQGGRS